MQLNDHPIHKDGIDEIIREKKFKERKLVIVKRMSKCMKKTKAFFSIIEYFTPNPVNLFEEESLHELQAIAQDEK